VLLVLLAAVLVPAGCVIWFMTEAVSNEALAVRQRLRDVYSEKMAAARKVLEWDLERRLTRLAEGADLPPAQRFALLAAESGADAVLICDKDGSIVYPDDAVPAADSPVAGNPMWEIVAELEREGDLSAAAAKYRSLAMASGDAGEIALALQGQTRCLLGLEQRREAVAVLDELLADEHLREAADPSGRLIGPNAQLLKLQLLADSKQPEFRTTADRLHQRLEDYRGAPMPAAQRRFLLHALEEIASGAEPSPTLATEDLAAEYLQMEQPQAEPGMLTPTRTAGLWQVATPERSVVALYRLDPLLRHWQELIGAREPAGALVRLRPPQGRAGEPEPFLSGPAGEHLPGWTLEVQLVGQDPFGVAASRKAAYLWTGGAGILLIVALAATVAGFVSRQMRLTRLKNDLIATVSHELKTPLASMRMLVDTLLEGRYRDQRQVTEYLQLIGRENQRLSRLIDNFLAFSRMERNKHSFQFAEVEVREIVAMAVEAVQDRFAGPGCQLEVGVAPGVSAVVGDRDALVTVLLNLLDNAHKYSREQKHVRVRAYSEDGQIVLSVRDNGIGIPRRAQRRIFERFYQVDQSLARKAGGCGLGLSIVQFIVTAHGGSIEVASDMASGTTFTVRLQAAPQCRHHRRAERFGKPCGQEDRDGL
jgi:signal transduction histidine kinase